MQNRKESLSQGGKYLSPLQSGIAKVGDEKKPGPSLPPASEARTAQTQQQRAAEVRAEVASGTPEEPGSAE